MALTKEQEKLWKAYRYVLSSEDDFLTFYHRAYQTSNEHVEICFHQLMREHLKKHMNVDLMMNYLDQLNIDSKMSTKEIRLKLHSFYQLLDQLNYSLSIEDATTLVEYSLFQNLFSKLFGRNKTITESQLKKIASDSIHMELLCQVYFDFQNVEIVDDVFENKDTNSKTKTKALTAEEEIELAKRIEAGDIQAQETFLLANEGLVKYTAQKYIHRGLEFEDLCQEGKIGLIKALSKFDYRRGCKFSAYASYWIHASIRQALADQVKLIRVPKYRIEEFFKINRVRSQMMSELQRDPSLEELAERLKMDEDEIQEILVSIPQTVSFESKVSDEDESELGDFYEDEKARFEDDVIQKQFVSELLANSKNVLKEREYQVLVLRFGIEDGCAKTLEEVSKIFAVTRERVRIIEATALRKLRGYCNKTYKCSTQANASLPKVEKKFKMFDIHEIHFLLTISIFVQLLQMFPEHEQKFYCQLRGIRLLRKSIIPKEDIPLADSQKKYVTIMENDLKYMASEYFRFLKTRKCDECITLQHISKVMIRRSLRFRYANVTQPKIMEAVRKLTPKRRELIFQVHGKDLCSYTPLKEPSSLLYLAYKDIDNILNGREVIQKKKRSNPLLKLREEYPKITREQWIQYVKSLFKKQKDAVFLIHGEQLDENQPFPLENYAAVYQSYHRAIQSLRDIAECKRIFIAPKERLLQVLGVKDISIVEEACFKLELFEREIFWEVHGKDFQESKEISDPLEYQRVIKKLKKILHQKETAFSKLMKAHPEIHMEQWMQYVKTLSKKQKEAVYLIHGEQLDENNLIPKNSYAKIYANYYRAIQDLNLIIHKLYYKIPEKNKTILDIYGKERVTFIFRYLNKEELSVFLYIHGADLNEFHEFPEHLNHLWNVYHKTIEKMKDLLELYNYFLRDFLSSMGFGSFEEAKYFISLLSISEQTIIYQRRGERLNTLNSFINGKSFECLKNQYAIAIGHLRQLKAQENQRKEEASRREILELQKQRLLDAKLTQYQEKFYQEFFHLFGSVIDENKLVSIIHEAILSYQTSEGLSIEVSCHFKIETALLELLLNQYQMTQRQDIFDAIVRILSVKLKDKYPFVQRNIKSSVIQEVFQKYIDQQLIFDGLGKTITKIYE